MFDLDIKRKIMKNNELNQDLLNREKFVGLLKDIIEQQSLNNQDGFSFAIDGKWGCGKSFILNMLEEQLRSEGNLVLHYNCWENDFYDEPLMAIISVIIDELEHLVKRRMKRSKKERLKSVLSFVKDVGATVFEYKTGLNATALIDAAQKNFESEEKIAISCDFDTMLPLKKAVDGVREKMQSLKKDFKVILIVVDELDRCLPEYAIKVLERLHHVCYGIPIVQLTAINKDELASSISKAFGKNFNNEMSLGWTVRKYGNDSQQVDGLLMDKGYCDVQSQFVNYYLLKFIQMVIPVPCASLNENSLAILNGFEEEFNPLGIVKIDYVQKFIHDVLDSMQMRDKETIIRQARTMHQVARARLGDVEKPSLGILCFELVESLFRFAKNPSKSRISVKSKSVSTYNYFFSLEEKGVLNESLKEWSVSNCSYSECRYINKEYSIYHISNPIGPQDYVKMFFLSDKVEKIERELRKFEFTNTKEFSDDQFARSLRDVMDLLN